MDTRDERDDGVGVVVGLSSAKPWAPGRNPGCEFPTMPGGDVLVKLTRSNEVPMLVLSGRSGETDRVVGLELGADDYMTKPFSARELVARVDVAIRRNRRHRAPNEMTFGELTINEPNREVHVGSRAVRLTAREFSRC